MEVSMAHLPGWVIVMDYYGSDHVDADWTSRHEYFLPLHSDFFFMRSFRQIHGSGYQSIRPSDAEVSG